MKKIFAAVFSMALVFGLAGCGSQGSEQANAPQTVEGQTDEASVAKARELMESLMAAPTPENDTEVVSVSTSTNVNGDPYSNTVTTTTMRDVTGDTPRFNIKVETDPAADTDATYYIEGVNGAVEQNGNIAALSFEQDYIDSLVNPEDSSDQYRVYYDCADQISYYEEGGIQYVMLQVNPQKLMESGVLSETFSNITSCIAEYTFNEEGRITVFLNTIEGTLVGTEGQDIEGTIETKCIFANYGTTEVPAVPESNVDDKLDAASNE